jgi:phage gpG-like protein
MGMIGRGFDLKLRGAKAYRGFLSRLNKKLGPDSPFFAIIEKEAATIIIRRTESGRDINGKPFKKKKDGSTTNLVKTRQMLNAVRTQRKGFVIIIDVREVNRRHIVAEVHNYGMISGRRSGRFKMPKREWFGLSAKDFQGLVSKVHLKLDGFIKRESRALKNP